MVEEIMLPSGHADTSGDGPLKNVVVVGAGPVGLMVALKLGLAGIPVDVFEKDSQLSQQPRAAGYYAGALSALQRLPIYGEATKLGYMLKGYCFRGPLVEDEEEKGAMRLGDLIAILNFSKGEETGDDPGNRVLVLPQNQLAQLLYKAALQTGLVNVYFNREVCMLHDRGDFVEVVARDQARGLTSFRAAFCVGADGGKSACRGLLKIPFKGHSWRERIVAIDVLLEDKNVDHEFPTTLIIHPVNFGAVMPLAPVQPGKKTLYRCTVAIDPNDERTDEELVSNANLMSLLNTIAPGPRPLDVEIVNSSPYRMHQVCAATLRKGRFVLAGDAAHLNTPWGALGLTTGLLDADALADTLEMIINENGPLELLSLYSDERRRVFQTFVDPTSTQNLLRCASDPAFAKEDWLVRAVVNDTTDVLEPFFRQFYDVWPTDIRKLAVLRGYLK
ncbi:Para-nitrophenol 4-monooxygenase [Talaromyces pinophilus]|nr:Para-nitrophenol 4-monooxygenase [Talaromyces pinophilus]